MLNVILTILLAPFLPIFFYGNFAHSDEVLSMYSEKNVGMVMGEKEMKEESFARQSTFPVEEKNMSAPIPMRKEDASDLKIWASSSVVIDVRSGTILHYDNGRKQTQVASLTKIMTAILTMEHLNNLNEEVVITREGLILPGTVVGCPRSGYCLSNRMYVGEKVRVVDLLKAALMNSANDAATMLGIHIAGTEEKFVEMMNNKANDLGLRDTNFCTPSGLETDGKESECYSSAYDLARIAAYSLKYEKIWEIMRIPEDRFFSTDGKYMHELKSTTFSSLEGISGCLGGKTGFTPLAGKSLMVGAESPDGKNKIVVVILNDETRWQDTKTLINWAFNNYIWK